MKRQQPIPSGPVSAPFWEAADQKKLITQICSSCHDVIFYPRYICPSCMSDQLDWKELPGTGIIYSFSTVTMHVDPQIAARVPLILALVELDNGPRMMSNIVNASVEEIEVGARVSVVWEECDKAGGGTGYLPVYELVN